MLLGTRFPPSLVACVILLSFFCQPLNPNRLQWLNNQYLRALQASLFTGGWQAVDGLPLGQVSIVGPFRGTSAHWPVLPKFEVTLQTPLYCSLNSRSLNGTVIAKYTYGKPVKGDVTLTFLPLSFWGMKKNITKNFKINGSANFSFNDEEMKKVMDFSEGLSEHMYLSSPGPVEILATVTESLTGISRNASSNVFFKQHDYIIEFFDYATVLKPSLNFTATVKVTRADGNRLTFEERRNNVVITVTQKNSSEYWSRWDSRNQETEAVQIINSTLPQNGIFKIEFPILDDSSELQLKASFLNSVSSMAVHGMFKSPSKTYIQLKTRDENIKVGSPFELVVSGNKRLKELSYMVVSRGQLVAVGKQNSTTFSLTPENSWAPKACIIVYYIEDDGEIINDVLKIPVQLVFKNKIKLFWSKAHAEPSEKVSLRISVTQPDSTVGIVAVDKSVNLMNVSNDITMENVVHELELYNTGYYLGMFMNSFAVFQRFAEETEGYLVHFHDFSSVSNPRIRKHFPETWIWLDTNMGSRIYQEFEVTVPDSITSWVATAFVISEDLGLGLTSTPMELQAFQPFFIFLNLPYSVIRGEEFALEVTIFNYLKDATEVKVIIEKSDKFDILMASNEINATGHQQTILVPSEDGATVLFPVKPTHLGEIPIPVTAISPAASDAVTQRILVKAEGIEKSYSQSILLDLTDNKLQTPLKTLSFSFPPNTVSGSERVQITAIGDILGSSINGLASLIRMPYGCGEQNMINFAPNIYVLDYLTKKRQLTENLKEKALSFMRQGRVHSRPYFSIDRFVFAVRFSAAEETEELRAFLLKEFPVQGRQFVQTHLGRHGVGTFSVHLKCQPNIDVQESINFLESEFNRGISDNYTLALITYALSSVGSPKAKEALNMLTWRAEQEGGMQFWVSSESKLSESWQPRSLDIEVAAYALLSHFLQYQVSEGIPIMRWLSRQRNSLGGFASTQDTIVALKALSEFAALMNTDRTNIQVTVMGTSSPSPVKFRIDTQNRFLLQTAEFNVIYNVKDLGSPRRRRSIQDQEAFDLDVAVKDNKDDTNHLNLNVCTRCRRQLDCVALQSVVFGSLWFAALGSKILYQPFLLLPSERTTGTHKTVYFKGDEMPLVCRSFDAHVVHNRVREQGSVTEFSKAWDSRQVATENTKCALSTFWRTKGRTLPTGLLFLKPDEEKIAKDLAVVSCLIPGFQLESSGLSTSEKMKNAIQFLGPARSGMALMEVNLLSGFTLPSDAIPLSETVNETQICVDIPAVRNFKVSNTQDALVSIMDYYEPRRESSVLGVAVSSCGLLPASCSPLLGVAAMASCGRGPQCGEGVVLLVDLVSCVGPS
ncbi:hypothetical protein GH733_000518 [Mirounga leonina]|nr:hypothetical protein GH733_000518 [Mirounga leonina]